MKRYLIAASASILAMTIVNGAAAQSKFEVKISGDAFFDAGATSQDRDGNRRAVDFVDRARLNILATGKSDNGLSYGVRLRTRSVGGSGGSNTFDADRAYIFMTGTFGQIQLGTTDGPNDLTIAIANGTTPFKWQTPGLYMHFLGVLYASNGNATAITPGLTTQTLADNAQASKIVYFSPRFSGFQAVGSYTPNSSSSGFDVDRNTSASSGYQDIWEIGANYDQQFSGVGIKFVAGYTGGKAKDASLAAREDLRALQVGGNISYAGVMVGANYINKWDSGLTKGIGNQTDQEVWSAGIQYETGPLTVGATYTRGEGNLGPYGVATTTTAGTTRYNGSVKQDVWQLGGAYALAPGLIVGAEYDYIKADAPGSANDDKANVFILRTLVFF